MTAADELALAARLRAAGHDPLQVSLLVHGADDITERLALAPTALAEAYRAAVDNPRSIVGAEAEDAAP